MFGWYELRGDSLKIHSLKREWLAKGLRDYTLRLAHTPMDNDVILITAQTAELQAFLEAHAGDDGAFDTTELKRGGP